MSLCAMYKIQSLNWAVFKLRAFTKQDKIEMVKCLSERQDVNWKLGEDGLMIRMGELVDSYPIYVLEVSLKNS